MYHIRSALEIYSSDQIKAFEFSIFNNMTLCVLRKRNKMKRSP